MNGNVNVYYWIGLQRAENPNECQDPQPKACGTGNTMWAWSNGDPFTYNGWDDPEEPNNNDGKQYYVLGKALIQIPLWIFSNFLFF